jgi:transposase InsO family protein
VRVQTLTSKTRSVQRFIRHGRRELVHLAVTAHPAAAWVWRPVVEATPWGRRPTHRIRDRDAVYGGDVRERAKTLGLETVLTPVRAPCAHAVAERVIGTLRRACLDHVIAVDERHLQALLAEYVEYDNHDRPVGYVYLWGTFIPFHGGAALGRLWDLPSEAPKKGGGACVARDRCGSPTAWG